MCVTPRPGHVDRNNTPPPAPFLPACATRAQDPEPVTPAKRHLLPTVHHARSAMISLSTRDNCHRPATASHSIVFRVHRSKKNGKKRGQPLSTRHSGALPSTCQSIKPTPFSAKPSELQQQSHPVTERALKLPSRIAEPAESSSDVSKALSPQHEPLTSLCRKQSPWIR